MIGVSSACQTEGCLELERWEPGLAEGGERWGKKRCCGHPNRVRQVRGMSTGFTDLPAFLTQALLGSEEEEEEEKEGGGGGGEEEEEARDGHPSSSSSSSSCAW